MNEAVVKMLRDLLERAERGDIIAAAVATIAPDLSTGSSYKFGDATLAELIGSVDLMKHRMLVNADAPIFE